MFTEEIDKEDFYQSKYDYYTYDYVDYNLGYLFLTN